MPHTALGGLRGHSVHLLPAPLASPFYACRGAFFISRGRKRGHTATFVEN